MPLRKFKNQTILNSNIQSSKIILYANSEIQRGFIKTTNNKKTEMIRTVIFNHNINSNISKNKPIQHKRNLSFI